MNIDDLGDKLERFFFSSFVPALAWATICLLILTIFAQAAMWAARG